MGWTDFLGQAVSGAIFGRQAAAQASSMSVLDKAKYLYQHGIFKSKPKPQGGSSMASIPYYLQRAGAALGPSIDDSYDMGGLGGGEGYRRRRRINPTNARAARRAVARLRSTLKLLKRIEHTMPHRACKRPHAAHRFGRK